MNKTHDLVVKTGSYQDNNGEIKGSYENVGSVMQGDNGMFLILKRTFNPAGVPNPDNKDSVILSCFEPKQQGQQQQQNQQQGQNGYRQQGQQNMPQQQQNNQQHNGNQGQQQNNQASDDFIDDIPF